MHGIRDLSLQFRISSDLVQRSISGYDITMIYHLVGADREDKYSLDGINTHTIFP